MPRALWNNTVIAESDQTKSVEGNYYFPPESVKREFLVESSTTTTCGWKGEASYYSVKVGEDTNSDAAWTYRHPKDAAKEIAHYIAFWKGVKIEA